MSRPVNWTEEEKGRLKSMYSSETPFEEIVEVFPNRTSNAIRLKASRLGLKRPTLTNIPGPPMMMQCVEGNGRSNGYVIRCNDCGNWVHLKFSKIGVCAECGAVCQITF